MSKKISAAQAKAQLASLISEVAYGGEHYVIERRGKPVAALVSVKDLERLEQSEQPPASPDAYWDFLALVGAWADVTDEEIDAFIADVYAERARDLGRPVNLEAECTSWI